MCTFDTSVTVWTHRTDPEWASGNAGCTDVLLVSGISRTAADCLVARLGETYKDVLLEIRDIHNVCVWANDARLIGQNRNARTR